MAPMDSEQERRTRERPQRSGDHSGDGRFDPDIAFDVIASADNAQQARDAISHFIVDGNSDNLRQAIAIYTRSARARGKRVENVLADLNGLTDLHHGRYQNVGRLLEPSVLKRLILETVMDGFERNGEPPRNRT